LAARSEYSTRCSGHAGRPRTSRIPTSAACRRRSSRACASGSASTILFDIEVVFLYPIAVELRAYGSYALAETITFIVLLFVAFVYVWRRGALAWK
jgi:Kef-type K+ transport system membrane component KefB